jgi:hydroxymethylpyrimidine pyrophosphatase-like HAD family hydrolase
MAVAEVVDSRLVHFLEVSEFTRSGSVMTDLDGTAVFEDRGRIYIPKQVEFGLKQMYDLGRPFILNSLRFPLSVMRTFGREWYSIANAPIPCVSLNGSLTGRVILTSEDELAFHEMDAIPLEAGEIDAVLDGLEAMLADGIKEMLLFYYPRDWRMGEIIWTPVPENVMPVKQKYLSASSVTAVELQKLREQLHAEDICMLFLLIDVPGDRLMAYQHTKQSSFFTHKGVDKLTGGQRLAAKLGLELSQSVGAGDTEMDRFLSGVGLAVHVGNRELEYMGVVDTIKVGDALQFGDLLFQLAELVRGRNQA